MQSSQYLPARFPFLLASDQNDHVGDERHAFQDDGEREEEPDRAPHGTEIAVAMAIFLVREVLASVCERGTATVETICVVNPSAAWLKRKMSMRSSLRSRSGRVTKTYCFAIPAYPSRRYYAGQGQDDGCRVVSE